LIKFDKKKKCSIKLTLRVRCLVTKQLGSGGIGEVFLCKVGTEATEQAIKIVRKPKELLELLLDGLNIMREVKDIPIAKIYETYYYSTSLGSESTLYILMVNFILLI
jgi:serine/threonine protein kinase